MEEDVSLARQRPEQLANQSQYFLRHISIYPSSYTYPLTQLKIHPPRLDFQGPN